MLYLDGVRLTSPSFTPTALVYKSAFTETFVALAIVKNAVPGS